MGPKHCTERTLRTVQAVLLNTTPSPTAVRMLPRPYDGRAQERHGRCKPWERTLQTVQERILSDQVRQDMDGNDHEALAKWN